MKRSRACEDLVALAQEASTADSRAMDAWPTHRCKRSRGSPASSGDEADDQELFSLQQDRHSLQFALETSDFAADALLSCSAPANTCVLDDDILPLRRNSRENMLLRKKKQRIAEITSSFNDFGLQDKEATPQQVVSSPETPEPRILRGLCFPRDSRCIDPLDKRQAQAFDMSAFIMLSVSPKR
ncbi:hypothetical protein PHYBOEH_000508 [Phytophthora boehmeriae]|uniref:Uncharacterized protein n=1 Tax=Phytophthora boehmeriae TaxID=109152 RepID=A0A8T1WVF6_9STRA|nr:hypothetical protein PHYBOEH_000508 [Phytophthora boehmeriae]